MITSESDGRKWVEYQEQEALEHDTEFMTSALERAGTYRGKQCLYGSRSSEDLQELAGKIWQAGMRRDWPLQRDLLITVAAVAARNARVAHALARPDLCTEVMPKPEQPTDKGDGL